MRTIDVPPQALKYVLFQRTQYLRFPKTKAYRVIKRLMPFVTWRNLVTVEAKLRSRRVRQDFSEDMARDYEVIKAHLPTICRNVLDIGSGVGGIDVMLGRHYATQEPTFFLLDKTLTEDSIYYGYQSRGAFYNSLAVAGSLLSRNGIAPEKIRLLEATAENEIDIDGGVDLVISLISWGFHYPIDTYVDRVFQLLSDSGTLVVDVRAGTDGLDTLRRYFDTLEVVGSYDKFQRVSARKHSRTVCA